MVFDLTLYLVTDRPLALGRSIRWVVRKAVEGGVTMVQLREKNASSREFLELALSLKPFLRERKVPLIINDRLDIALAADADGLHIGQNDLPIGIARRLLGPDKIIGLSVENPEQAREAEVLDADYLGLSPVFTTPTKEELQVQLGLEQTAEIAALSKHRTVGIGGIHTGNVQEVMQTGIDGVAVVSGICSAADPEQAAKEFLREIRMMRND